MYEMNERPAQSRPAHRPSTYAASATATRKSIPMPYRPSRSEIGTSAVIRPGPATAATRPASDIRSGGKTTKRRIRTGGVSSRSSVGAAGFRRRRAAAPLMRRASALSPASRARLELENRRPARLDLKPAHETKSTDRRSFAVPSKRPRAEGTQPRAGAWSSSSAGSPRRSSRLRSASAFTSAPNSNARPLSQSQTSVTTTAAAVPQVLL